MTTEDRKKPARHVLSALMGEAWAITEAGYDKLVEIASRENVISAETAEKIERRREAVAARKAAKMDNTEGVLKRDGVGIIEVAGPIFRYADLFSQISGATSIETLATDFNAAMNDPSIRGVVLTFDSPGGQVSGVNELANMIASRRGEKPIISYVGNAAASAAYWLASAADEVVVDATAEVGSIGAVIGARKMRGGDYVEVVSKQSPKKRLGPDTEAGRLEMQKTADTIADVFIAAVKRNRGENVGLLDGGLAMGQEAVDAGLADRVGSFESIIVEIGNGISQAQRKAALAASKSAAAGSTTTLSNDAEAHANALIDAGKVDRTSPWSFTADDENRILGDPPNWTEYGKWHLGRVSGADSKTKAAYKYPYGKNGKVYRSGVIAVKSRAAQQGDDSISAAAGRLLDKIDKKKETAMSEETLKAELEQTRARLAEATSKLTKVAEESRKRLIAAAESEAKAFIGTLSGSKDLRFGKEEMESFGAIFTEAKKATASENEEVAKFATSIVGKLETYAQAKAPVAPAGEKKPGKLPEDKEGELTKDDFAKLGIDLDVDAKVARAIEICIAEKNLSGPTAYEQALNILAKKAGVRLAVGPASYIGSEGDDEGEE
jgi:ClpP class serine protease